MEMPGYISDIGLLPINSRIIVYGAGRLGQSFIESVEGKSGYHIVGVADRDADIVRLFFPDHTVISPDGLNELQYDFIIVTIENIDSITDVVNSLVMMGIDSRKIKLLKKIESHKSAHSDNVEIRKFVRRNLKREKKIWLFMLPEHGNMGDYALGYAEENFFREYYPYTDVMKVTTNEWRMAKDIISECVNETDVIFLNGGGYIGDLWDNTTNYRSIVEAFPNNNIFFFPNTLTYKQNDLHSYDPFLEDISWFSNQKNVYVMFRDRRSYDTFYPLCQNSFLFPDMVLSLRCEEINSERSRVLLCLRRDRERIFNNREDIIQSLKNASIEYDEFDICLARYISQERGRDALKCITRKMQNYSCVVTDRLHGMLFSVISNTPCVAIDNRTHKVSGVYEWIKDKGYVVLLNQITYENIADDVKKAIRQKETVGIYQPLDMEYKKMVQVIEEKCKTGIHNNKRNYE